MLPTVRSFDGFIKHLLSARNCSGGTNQTWILLLSGEVTVKSEKRTIPLSHYILNRKSPGAGGRLT